MDFKECKWELLQNTGKWNGGEKGQNAKLNLPKNGELESGRCIIVA